MHADAEAQGGLEAHKEADVVVVGAGLAGLMAARALTRAGIETIVLEARERIGGRLVNQPIGDGAIVEMGGQFVGNRDARLRALLAELGLETFPVHDRGRHLLALGRGTRRYRGSIPRVAPRALLDLARARWRLDRSARRVPAATPWEAPEASELDQTTFDQWLDGNVSTREARSLLETAVGTIWAEDPHGVNLLSALAFVNMAGSFEALGATRGGLLQDRIVGGPMRLAQLLATELGERVLCSCPVEAIVDRRSSVEVETGGTRVTARRAIVTVPPALAREIRFEPELPESRRRALDSLPMGAVIKVAAVYERPFWRDRGLSGRALSSEGPVTAMFDNSPPNAEPGVLVGFVPGARARELGKRPEPERREAVLGAFARLFGADVEKPEQYVEKDWIAEPWSQGCYFGLPQRGALSSVLSSFAAPTGSIHWAGSETAFEAYGGMDGALRSGERAAEEALAALAGASARTRDGLLSS